MTRIVDPERLPNTPSQISPTNLPPSRPTPKRSRN